MATMQELRQEAKAAGVPTAEIRSAESADELQNLIAGLSARPSKKKGNVMASKPMKKSAVAKKAVVKKAPVKRGRPVGSKNKPKVEEPRRRGRPPGSKNKPKVDTTATPKRRGRPPGSKNKPKVTTEIKKRGRPVGSKNKPKTTTPVVKKRGPGRPPGSKNKATVQKSTTRKATNGRYLRNISDTDGRHILGDIDYSEDERWNPRTESPPDLIIKALRRFRGDRQKVFEHFKDDVWYFVGKRLRNGSTRKTADAYAMLKYRIARTDWDFAMKTGQHKKSTKRVEYGTGGFGKAVKKSTRKAPVAAPKRRGRPPGSKNRVTAKATPVKRGRPVGSRNKTTARKATISKRGPGRPKGSGRRSVK
jgi:hypothetical protein